MSALPSSSGCDGLGLPDYSYIDNSPEYKRFRTSTNCFSVTCNPKGYDAGSSYLEETMADMRLKRRL